jgi:hypothetical protein
MGLTLTWLSVIILIQLAGLFLKTFELSLSLDQFRGILSSRRTLKSAFCERPLRADSVEKVFFDCRTKFLRTADAFCTRRREGPHRSTQKRPGIFVLALWRFVAIETSKNRVSRNLWRRTIFDCFNTIRQRQPFTQSSYSYGKTIKTKRPRGLYTAWPLLDP